MCIGPMQASESVTAKICPEQAKARRTRSTELQQQQQQLRLPQLQHLGQLFVSVKLAKIGGLKLARRERKEASSLMEFPTRTLQIFSPVWRAIQQADSQTVRPLPLHQAFKSSSLSSWSSPPSSWSSRC